MLRLANHVRACRVGDHVVLLDLRRGRYIGVGCGPTASLMDSVIGWPEFPHDCDLRRADKPKLKSLAAPLLHQGLLDEQIHLSERCCTDAATLSLNAGDTIRKFSLSLRTLFNFVSAAARVAVWLHWRTLQSIATDIATRRDSGHLSAPVVPTDQMRNAVAAFERLRPLLFTARDKCLYDSLVLVNFLAAEGLYAQWIVGVKVRPFGAHSWVQCGRTVLNDQHENVRRFSPILVV